MIASVGLPAGVLASIWLIGDLSYDGPVDGGLDHAARPVEVAPATIPTAGAVAVLALLGAAVLTGRSRGGRWVLATLTAAGAAIGLLYRVVTAGVIGANIGAGLAFFLIPPLVLILLVTAVVLAVRRDRGGDQFGAATMSTAIRRTSARFRLAGGTADGRAQPTAMSSRVRRAPRSCREARVSR